MEPENSDIGKRASDNFQRMEDEIEGSPVKVNVPVEESRGPSTINVHNPEANMPSSTNITPQGDKALGYNPNGIEPSLEGQDKVPEAPILGTKEEDKGKEEDKSKQTPSSREGAPDIGKDYGDSLGNPGVKTVEREAPNLAERGAAHPENAGSSGTGLEKESNGLEKDKKEEDGKEPALKNKNDKENNPEAPNVPKKDEKKDEQIDQTGNGYGALKKPNKPTQPNDSTSLARRNFEHSNKINQGAQEEKGVSKAPANKKRDNSSSEPSGLNALGSKLKNSVSSLFNRGSKSEVGKGDGKAGNKMLKKFLGDLKKKILSFLASHPHVAIILIIILILFILILMSVVDDEFNQGSGKKGTKCTYSLKGVTSSGSIELTNLQVELINCDGTASDYTVLETVDFEKYVLGVALAEIGPDSPDEAIKTQIIAARNFALTRNSGMCPGNPDNCFYGYNVSTGKIRMRACEADQVYWDYEKDIYRQDRGSISIYSPEINSGTLWKSALSDTRKAEVIELAAAVKGEVLVDSSDSVIPTPYVASTSEQFLSLAREGKTYEQILTTVYSDGKSLSKAQCSSYGNIDYGDYILSSDGTEILHQPLDDFLVAKGTNLDEFNNLISANVEKAGYGTRAGVVAAAVTLIAELGNNYGVKVPYYWGGGHYDGVVDGALGYWGSTQCHTYANGQSYNYCGLDCSGFVPWAIKNGGFNISQMLAGNFQNLQGAKRVSLSSGPVLEPGDLLESSGHIVLVVGIDEASGVYICAEASGNSAGVLFTKRSFNQSGYWGVQMDGYYDTHARS